MQKLNAEIDKKLEDWYRYVESSGTGAADGAQYARTPRKPSRSGSRRFRFSPGGSQPQQSPDTALLADAPAPAKETREELLARLLDPVLTLEEAAQVLNVCPTTVRRYTNRGLLAHHRTVGNQRRFRLSHVLAFLAEMTERPGAGTLTGDTAGVLAEFSAARRMQPSNAIGAGSK